MSSPSSTNRDMRDANNYTTTTTTTTSHRGGGQGAFSSNVDRPSPHYTAPSSITAPKVGTYMLSPPTNNNRFTDNDKRMGNNRDYSTEHHTTTHHQRTGVSSAPANGARSPSPGGNNRQGSPARHASNPTIYTPSEGEAYRRRALAIGSEGTKRQTERTEYNNNYHHSDTDRPLDNPFESHDTSPPPEAYRRRALAVGTERGSPVKTTTAMATFDPLAHRSSHSVPRRYSASEVSSSTGPRSYSVSAPRFHNANSNSNSSQYVLDLREQDLRDAQSGVGRKAFGFSM
eukprot:GFYU01026948.1.p1 GENE.GFYU01026948.1~~GFYU01026948.1.p1  ORF type:complete len:335 (-),score=-15.40 GFYU01026948.1:22-882(-)